MTSRRIDTPYDHFMKKNIFVIFVNIIIFTLLFIVSLLFYKNKFMASYRNNLDGKNEYFEVSDTVKHYVSFVGIRKKDRKVIGFQRNSSIKHKLASGKEIVYDVSYNIDQNGNRKTYNTSAQKNDLYLYGCSDVFGFGVNDTETLASQLSSHLKNLQVHNLGIPGAGGNVFFYLLSQRAYDHIKPGDEIVYVAAEGHINRTVGQVPPYMDTFPKYDVIDSKLTYMDTFASSKITGLIRETVLESWLINFVNFNNPSITTKHTKDINCSIINEAQRLISSKKASFHILLHPSLQDFEREFFNKCILENGKIKSLDVSWPPEKDAEYFIAIDGHPSAKGNKDLAERLAKHIIESEQTEK